LNSPKEIAQNYITIGTAKTKLPISKMLVLGMLAGMFIALAGVGATVSSATITTASVAKLVGACVFPVGLAMVLLAGSELFTGNCLLIIPVLEKKASLGGMLKNWIFVYIGNLIGSLIVAALVVYGHTFSLFSNAASVSVISTALGKVSLAWGDAFFRGILCNFLVCIAVWMAFAAKDVVGKMAGLFMPVMLFVLNGFEHSIANMYFISAGILAKGNPAYAAAYTAAHPNANLDLLNWGSFFAKNLLPVTLGNIIGGMVLVGMAYWFIYLRNSDSGLPAQEKSKVSAGK